VSTKKTVREVIEMAESFGMTLDGMSRSRHVQLLFTTPKGAKKILTVSVSASDGRAAMNNKSILKKWATE
jgi:hypothetical protein